VKVRVKTAVFALLATLAVLGGAELVARVAGTVKGDLERAREAPQETWLNYSESIGWERRPGFRGEIAGMYREFDAQGFIVGDLATAGSASNKKRVLFFGDSNTFGFGVSTEEAFPKQVERRLPGIASINLGVIGYSSHQGYLAVQKNLPVLQPDLIVVSFNFNDRRYVTSSAASDGPLSFERAKAAGGAFGMIAYALEYVHLYRLLRSSLQAAGLLAETGKRIDIAGLLPRVDEDAYRRNLMGITESARKAGIPVLFLVLKDNPMQSDHLNEGVAAIDRNDLESSVAYLNSAAASHRMFSNLARVYLAQALSAKGDVTRARAALADGELYRSFSGGTVIRRDVAYNEIMRQVARESGATIVEAGTALDRHPSVYFDFCHFSAEGHRIVADLLAPAVAALLGPAPTATR